MELTTAVYETERNAALQMLAALIVVSNSINRCLSVCLSIPNVLIFCQKKERGPNVKDEEQFLPVSHLCVHLCSTFPEFTDILMGHMYSACPFVVPVTLSTKNINSSKWKELMGFEKVALKSGKALPLQAAWRNGQRMN
jgi:hypothetical protein